MGITAPEVGYSSLAEQAYHVLRDRIIMLDIAPGSPINEAQLAADLDIGRTPIREGLKKLELDHLVVSYPRRGTFATQVDITDLASICELRLVLEPVAARKAALLARPAIRSELALTAQQIAAMGEEPPDKRPLMEYDIKVHRLIYRAADNLHLEETLVRLDNLATRIWCLALDRLPSLAEHVREHVGLLEAIVDGDADDAAELAAVHVSHFEASIRAVL